MITKRVMTHPLEVESNVLHPRNIERLQRANAPASKSTLYLFVFSAWILSIVWFQSRLMMLFDMAETPLMELALGFFVVFIAVAWLYGFYNLGVIIFAKIYQHSAKPPIPAALPMASAPPVALLYTTCNDFVEESALSCVKQAYKNYTVYILDDSSDPAFKERIDQFAELHSERVKVIRRKDRKGFKAGNLNHALSRVAREPYFAIADADEILPTDFLSKLVPHMETDANIGFVQANHRANPGAKSSLAQSMGIGIDIHWRWYQPLRNKFGFVMFLGHGALLRRRCWEAIGGFPEIVSEDLAFAIRIRELGWKGKFVEEVVCYEDFPETIRNFRVRHMKWTRGTCEFLTKEGWRLLKARKVSWAEKCDILFPTLNLPLTLFYFLFMIDANLLLPLLFGVSKPVTLAFSGQEIVLPTFALHSGFNAIYSSDFFLITLLTFMAPVLCFMMEMWKTPVKLFRFLCDSTLLYSALGPLSAIGVLSYAVTGKAIFLVTGDQSSGAGKTPKLKSLWKSIKQNIQEFLNRSHPDSKAVQLIELLCGVIFAVSCLYLFQISFFGLALAFGFMPFIHYLSWKSIFVQSIVYLPFTLILLGLLLGGFSLLGMSTMFFSFGFHF